MSAKKIFSVLLTIIGGAAALAISFIILIVYILSGVISLAVRRLPRKSEWARTVWYLIIVVALIASALVARSIRSRPAASCDDSIRGFFGKSSDQPQRTLTRVSPNAAVDLQHTIDAEGLELLQHAVAAKKSGAVLNSARATKSLFAGDLSGDDTTKLSAAIDSLQESVNSLNRDGLEARMDRLKSFVADKREQARKVSDSQEFLDEFERFKTDEKWSFEDIYSKMVSLQDLVSRFVDSKAKDRITVATVRLTAHLDEDHNILTYEERVGIALGKEITLRQIDFSELLLDGQFSGMNQSVLYSFDNAPPVATNSASVAVPDGVRNVTVLNQVRTSANLEDACNASRLLPLRRFFVKWPDVAPSSIGLQLNVANLANRAGSVPYYFRQVIDKKGEITEIELPEFSFFSSNYGMKEDTNGLPAGITPDPPVSAATSNVSQPIEIELLPEYRIFRNSPVQGERRYLFPLNAVIFFVFLAIGSAFSWMVDPKKRRKP
jgi:hypothetical protein